MRISDWSSDVCSSDLLERLIELIQVLRPQLAVLRGDQLAQPGREEIPVRRRGVECLKGRETRGRAIPQRQIRSEEHTSELQSLMRISYAVFCLKKKNNRL